MCVQVKHALQFAGGVSGAARGGGGGGASVHLPEGAKGDMCRAVQDDVEFGRWFVAGPNPMLLRRCCRVPTDRLPVTDDMLDGLLDRSGRLDVEAQVPGWRRGAVLSGVRRMDEVNARRARLLPGWVTVFGRVYHLGMLQAN